jgi:hypothetical protein
MHIKFFLGDKYPETAIKLYHQYLGGGYIVPPFWYQNFTYIIFIRILLIILIIYFKLLGRWDFINVDGNI